jgi:hypothetical protein
LPDETSVLIEEEHLEGTVAGLSGSRCCPPVKEGMLIAHVSSPDCGAPEGSRVSTGFRVRLTVAPDAAGLFRCLSFNCGSEQQQPKEVLEILGSRFENVHGDQVTTVQGVKALVATGTYDWPAGTCAGFFDSPGCWLSRASEIPSPPDDRPPTIRALRRPPSPVGSGVGASRSIAAEEGLHT